MNLDFELLSRDMKRKGFDVDSIADRLGKPIESKIKPLVLALNYKGYQSEGSCEGHSLSKWESRMKDLVDAGEAKLVFRAERGLTYQIKCDGKIVEHTFNEIPWVDIISNEERVLFDLGRIVRKHNENGILWRFDRFSYPSNLYRLETLPTYDLEVAQRDIIKLAEEIITD